eukprot:TRINITY_DN19101_c0_g1_i1.p1 TRINITY_DN19101_c0_g1~~TRINITY_DN19101_c0_g1_i1.p1  ORF type:complete len:367 (+),score=55.43 TRINITY_DN19101_c0_g1_i1:367-1467(+)
MDAYEGFLTSVYSGGDVFRPTFFELIAQEQLMDVLRSALRFAIGIWAERAPAWLLPLFSRWEAVYSAGLLFLEGYHLRIHGATFAEHFFGLRRQEIASGRALSPLEAVERERRRRQAPLTRRQQTFSLAVAVLLPWLRSQCEARFRQAEAPLMPARSNADRVWLRTYPWVHAGHILALFGYRLLYLLERMEVWSPWLHLLGLRLVRHFPDPPASAADKPHNVMARLRDSVGSLGAASLWGAVYLMQFLQWWYQRAHLLQPYQPKKAPPPPPERAPYQEALFPTAVAPRSSGRVAEGEGGPARLVLLPEDSTICALCHRVRRNPAMSCSGYVFCYPCLLAHVQQHSACPVTGLAMTEVHVRRLREDG